MTNAQAPVRMHVHWLMKVIFALAVVDYSWESFVSWRQGDLRETLTSVVSALIVVWAFLLARTKVDVDQQGIRIIAPHGVYELHWTEMRTVELKNNVARFFGDNKAVQLVFLLAGKGKREFQQYVAQSIREKQIPAGRPPGIGFLKLMQLQRNAKVRGWNLL